LTETVEKLKKILALEQQRKFRDSSVIGGLDGYLLKFAQESGLGESHRFTEILKSLPYGGYRALHPVQRQTVVEALLAAVENGVSSSSAKARAPATKFEVPPAPKAAPKKKVAPEPAAAVSARVIGTVDSPVSALPGVTRGMQTKFENLNVHTIRDLLFHFPRRYHDYSEQRPIAELQPGEEQTIVGEIWSSGARMIGPRRKAAEVILGDETGTIQVLWWGRPWIAKSMKQGRKIALRGMIKEYRGRLSMDAPEIEEEDEETLSQRRVVPDYPSTERLEQKTIRNAVRVALDSFANKIEDPLPDSLRRRFGLMPVADALRQIHVPDTIEAAEEARNRFAFEELLMIEVGVVRRKREWEAQGGAPELHAPEGLIEGFEQSLPFPLTDAQGRAIETILADVARDVPMSRLLEGDVGSGKTVVSAAALLAAVGSGYQSAIMAPTEILAEQHFRTFSKLLDERVEDSTVDGPWFQETGAGYVALRPVFTEKPVKIALLTGSLKGSEKDAAREAIARGEVDIAVGTHALVQQEVEFDRLGVAVVDEQHRFGVAQRAALREKGGTPHVLVMTATPIPRTLALTVYGDLDVTILDEMPPGRPEVKTRRVMPRQRQEAWDFVRKKVGEGRQAYIICPLVEESEAIEAKAAVQEHERLSREVFPELKLGLLHGRMTPGEKDAAMRSFRDGELDILVSTAVVEVGIDVPNATVMLVEGADRFGLSQLHQFRGRVRRSSEQAYCLLLADNPSEEGQERLRIMETTSDGFKLAEEDLRIRGPGEYFGTRQSGMPDLKLAKLTDVALIEKTREAAGEVLDDDPDLGSRENAGLRKGVERIWGRITAEVS
jgi:ATP-dependent DNA helicase RecG